MKAVEILCYSCVILFLFFSSLLVLSAKLIIKSMLLLSMMLLMESIKEKFQ